LVELSSVRDNNAHVIDCHPLTSKLTLIRAGLLIALLAVLPKGLVVQAAGRDEGGLLAWSAGHSRQLSVSP
jgi:hypothetical protein